MTTNDTHTENCASLKNVPWPPYWEDSGEPCSCHVAELKKLREELERAEGILRRVVNSKIWEYAKAYFDQKGK